jgi:hypothetical protein
MTWRKVVLASCMSPSNEKPGEACRAIESMVT